MQLIIAIIKPARLPEVRDALHAVGCNGLTVSEVKGFGQQKGLDELYRGATYRAEFLPKLRLDIAVHQSQTTEVVEAIRKAAHTGKTGDGKIFVLNLEHAVRIRTAETDEQAI
ncbi:MAG: nitrogen regulatory protein P-II GlnK [Idiomarinaceae bacterium HL-53]|nr:MAG: nitrogen regulatory protein P-II GlnK [Idiomarinaceae bacterium HL-53]CUS48078.1 nitrogen regulatory protein P-II family [Idiomarinaceae bacterium HL-53]